MKKIISTVIVAAYTAVSAFAQDNATIASIAIGNSIPKGDVKLVSTKGDKIALNEAKTSKGLLVMFSCNTCPYVIKSQGRTKQMMDYTAKNGIGMVVINSNEAQRDEADSYAAMKAYAEQQHYRVPYVTDEKSELANAFGATRTPEVFLFDANGKLVYKGAMEDNPSSPSESKEMYLTSAMENMLAGKTITLNSTKSVGCSIKRAK